VGSGLFKTQVIPPPSLLSFWTAISVTKVRAMHRWQGLEKAAQHLSKFYKKVMCIDIASQGAGVELTPRGL